MAQETITKNEAVIHALMNGGLMNAVEVAEKVTDETGLSMTDSEATSLLSKLQKTDLGHFIKRHREGRRFFYEMIEEAKYLAPEQARGLSLKRGKDRYTLEHALTDYPDLAPYAQEGPADETEPEVEETEVRVAPPAPAEPAAAAAAAPSAETYAAPAFAGPEMDGTVGELIQAIASGINVNVRISIKFE